MSGLSCLVGGLLYMLFDEIEYDGIDTSHAAGIVNPRALNPRALKLYMFKLNSPFSFILTSLGPVQETSQVTCSCHSS